MILHMEMSSKEEKKVRSVAIHTSQQAFLPHPYPGLQAVGTAILLFPFLLMTPIETGAEVRWELQMEMDILTLSWMKGP